ncbi:MAG: gliding motility-associated C-terminal domain-containing protein [Paludibacteraceae bacterium]|nr:gliding motility-associated C-terminal domain-containing protein [Paludibacteraceae bacterium]
MKLMDYRGVAVKVLWLFAIFLTFQVESVAQGPADGPGGPGDGPGGPGDAGYTVTIQSDQVLACPGDPLSFTAVPSETLSNPTYRWYVKEGDGEFKLSGVYDGNTFAVDEMPDMDLYVYVECEDNPAPGKPGKPGKVISEVFEVAKSTSCNVNICHQTTTGEYYGGTDFNYAFGASSVDWNQNPPAGLEEYFSQQGIHFRGREGSIENQTELGVSLYIDDSMKVNPNNKFYVQRPRGAQGVNADLFDLRFDADKFSGKNYSFTMRFYLILPPGGCNVEAGAKLIARTGHGTQTEDHIRIKLYYDPTNTLLTTYRADKGTGVAWYEFANDLNSHYNRPEIKSAGAIYRFEMEYFGYMPPVPGLSAYSFQPYFENFPKCATVAIDYISAQAESVCVTPRSACVGDYITANAAGFHMDEAKFVWKKYTDQTYSQEMAMDADEIIYHPNADGVVNQVEIKMKSTGVFYYSVQNMNPGETGISEPIKFTLVGRNCNVKGPGIDGNSDVCVAGFPHKQTFSAHDPEIVSWLGEFDTDYTFQWSLRKYVPDTDPQKKDDWKNEVGEDEKITLQVADDKQSVDLIVAEGAKMSDKFTPDTCYKLILGVYKMYNGVVAPSHIGADTFNIWVYDQPNIDNLNFVTLRGEDDICAAYASDTIVLKGLETIASYDKVFEGATMDSKGILHINGFNKDALCNSSIKEFPVKLTITNKRCVAVKEDKFKVQSTDDPKINCDKLSDLNTYDLAESKLDTLIYLPVPDYETSCDDNPALNVKIHYDADEKIHSFDSTIVLRLHRSKLVASELPDDEKVQLRLFSGKGTVSYSLVDGCGKKAECQINLAINDTTPLKVSCDSLESYHVEITSEDGCKATPGKTEGLPVLKPRPLRDMTFTDTVIMIEGVYVGRSAINTDPGLDSTQYNRGIDLNADYDKGITYILWRYTDPAGHDSYCQTSVTVVNKNDPFKCSQLTDIRVSVNENKKGQNYRYASAQAQSTVNPDTKYSLQDVLKIPEKDPAYCGDVQLKILITGVCVDDKGDSIATAKDSLLTNEEFMKHRFPVGVTYVTYRFITANDTVIGKKDSMECNQQIIVTSKDTPEPDDCPDDPTLYVDENCLAKWNFELNMVPTAKITYFKEVKYTYDECGGGSYDYHSLGTSEALSKDYKTTGYPFMVRRISFLDEDWKATDKTQKFDCENVLTSLDTVSIKEVHHRMNADKSICKIDPYESMKLKVTNFAELPSCVTDSFTIGRHIVVWYFDNGKGVLDSCVTKITVLDTVPPVPDCGKWGEESLFYCDESCEVPYEKVDIRIPTVDDLHAYDNCSEPEDLKITWKRVFKDSEINTFEQNYPLGSTTITWTLTDLSGNSSNCVQVITVLDTLPPAIDCSKIPNISVAANENCEATAQAVVEAGLSTPIVDDDPCSPTGGSIQGVGRRSDNKDIFKDPYPKDTTIITWTFTDKAGNSDSCKQLIIVIDSMAPVPPDCGNLTKKVVNLDPDSCMASQALVRDTLGEYKAEDNCDGVIYGVPMMTLADSSYVELPEFFKKDTTYLISWVFTDKNKNITICYQDLEIRDTTPPDPSGICPDPEKSVAATVECSVDYDKLGIELGKPVLDDPCDGDLIPTIIGYVNYKDGTTRVYRDEDLKGVKYPVGTHKFVWLYTDNAGLQDSCVQYLSVTDSVDLQLTGCDVDKEVIVTLPKGKCGLDPKDLKNHMTIPTAYDLCDEEEVLPRVERRFEGELVVDEEGKPIAWDSQDFPLGRTDIRWIFVDKLGVMKDSCEKTLIVKTELYDCSQLQDVVTVNLMEKYKASAEDVKAAGLRTPVIDFDKCNAATLSFERVDSIGNVVTDTLADYPIGKYDVSWTFKYVFGDTKVCKQQVVINDMVPLVVECPNKDESVVFDCYGTIPPPYASIEEFLANGGKLSERKKYKEGSFGYRETEEGAAPCEYKLHRTYFVLDIRDQEVSCTQEFLIHDVTAPVFVTKLDTLVFSCDQEIPSADTIVVKAEDNCSPDSTLTYKLTITDNRSSNADSCGYNTYTIWREWRATDMCGNVSSPLIQVVQIVDTLAPKFVLPEDWRDTVMANNIKNCEVSVPLLADMLKNHIEDACTDPSKIKLWQVPAAGTIVEKVTTVFIYAEDLCGNRDSLSVVVYVDHVKNIVTLNANSLVLCGSDTASINLWSQEVRLAVGQVSIEDMGEITTVPSIFTYDCYRGYISESTLVYSNNRLTYADRFSDPDPVVADSIFKSKVNLRKKDQTDTYFFVAMDTLTQCMDTASAYLTIFERPRVAMLSDTFYHCENDTLDMDELFFNHHVCLDDMGRDLTKTGWTIDGVDYVAGTPIPYNSKPSQMYFFAENECGRSTTYDSYFTYCSLLPLTKEDSLALVGSEEDLALWRRDELHSKDSIVFIVNQRYRSDSIFLYPTADLPSNSIWIGDEVTMKTNTPYSPAFYRWMKVIGTYDGVHPDAFDKYGDRLDSLSAEAEDQLLYYEGLNPKNEYKFVPQDSSLIYVLIGDGVCPAVPSNVFGLNVMDRLPTAFTPFNKDGLNDYFLKGRTVTIFDRYGQRVFEGNDGWDGTTARGPVDPGVYFYDVRLNSRSFQGTIEVVYLK